MEIYKYANSMSHIDTFRPMNMYVLNDFEKTYMMCFGFPSDVTSIQNLCHFVSLQLSCASFQHYQPQRQYKTNIGPD